ncbi:hypothetical protein RHVP.42 [Cricetid gammaherpesvirus 2]|uniref:Uncharacterized protein n=1 Tax=Cricetid gammaherpesvirus 2 TaxID=1605972 RepID=E9M5M5_9GAMA|nr:hypothetical protein RHVP.42 [Cricetid gammaherpesvirus 2]ADW24383.1 hypothetical protein RHVP.42 [Cricetid gammaherpesvirus 2]ADW24465.1 hypothetical protein RHVP-L.42 [Cricetid gammaherpesvirus 2]
MATAKTLEKMMPVIIPRMMLELSTNGKVTVAANSPLLVKNSTVNVKAIKEYIKDKMQSGNFKAFVFASVIEHEDTVASLDMYPHVYQSRILLFMPPNAVLFELCMLVSMMENLIPGDGTLAMAIFQRGKTLFEKNPSADSLFLFKGLSVLTATHLAVYNPAFSSSDPLLKAPLLTFKLFAAIENMDSKSQGLLKSIVVDSFRMQAGTHDDGWVSAPGSFSLLYKNTIFTKHLQVSSIVFYLKMACLLHEPTSTIISE